MGRKPKGKRLTLRPIRLDDDVWAECQRLGKEHGTINEGLRIKLFHRCSIPPPVLDGLMNQGRGNQNPDMSFQRQFKCPTPKPTRKRGLRPKGDRQR